MEAVVVWSTLVLAIATAAQAFYLVFLQPRRERSPKFLITGEIKDGIARVRIRNFSDGPLEVISMRVVKESWCSTTMTGEGDKIAGEIVESGYEREFELKVENPPPRDGRRRLFLEIRQPHTLYGVAYCDPPFVQQGDSEVLKTKLFPPRCIVDLSWDVWIQEAAVHFYRWVRAALLKRLPCCCND